MTHRDRLLVACAFFGFLPPTHFPALGIKSADQIVQKLRSWPDAGDKQMVTSACRRRRADVVLYRRLHRDRHHGHILDALLRRDHLVVARPHCDGAKFQSDARQAQPFAPWSDNDHTHPYPARGFLVVGLVGISLSSWVIWKHLTRWAGMILTTIFRLAGLVPVPGQLYIAAQPTAHP